MKNLLKRDIKINIKLGSFFKRKQEVAVGKNDAGRYIWLTRILNRRR